MTEQRICFNTGDLLRAGAAIAHSGSLSFSPSVEYHQAGGPLPIAHVGSALLVGRTIEAIMTWLDEGIACYWVAAGDDAMACKVKRMACKVMFKKTTGHRVSKGRENA